MPEVTVPPLELPGAEEPAEGFPVVEASSEEVTEEVPVFTLPASEVAMPGAPTAAVPVVGFPPTTIPLASVLVAEVLLAVPWGGLEVPVTEGAAGMPVADGEVVTDEPADDGFCVGV